MLRILLASASGTISPVVSAVLENLRECRIVAEVHQLHETLDAVRRQQPDVLLYDLPLTKEAIAVLHLAKQAVEGLKVVVLTPQVDQQELGTLTQVPVDALVLTRAEEAECTDGRHCRPGLSQRETDILRLLAEGQPNRAIAERLSLAPQTVRNSVSRLYQKLQTNNRIEASRRARHYLKSS